MFVDSTGMEQSSDDGGPGTSSQQPQSSSRKRTSRACDQCRRMKTRCDRPSGGGPCQTCGAAGVACTFSGPSFKRGPPKGYINALEQRWYQAESILVTLLTSPNPTAQAVVALLRQDDLARDVLNRVDAGPLGPSGRLTQPVGATMEDVVASFLADTRTTAAGPNESFRPQRQSRVTREIVSSSPTSTMAFGEIVQWQDRLGTILASSPTPYQYPGQMTYGYGFQNAPHPAESIHRLSGPQSISSLRLEPVPLEPGPIPQPDFSRMYTMETPSDAEPQLEIDRATDAFGHLSLDENREVRYHGDTSGLRLLGTKERVDGRNEGGIWKLPMARIWPLAQHHMLQYPTEDDIHVQMPPIETQETLLHIYFTYVHPVFPVVHKAQFMADYNASKNSFSPNSGPATGRVSRGLLLTMLSIAIRYCSNEVPAPPEGEMSELGCDYAGDARELITKTLHHSRPSTCQALLILGIRELAIGSTEQAWLYTGMAIRMAFDLGLNRTADEWHYNGADLFTASEKQTRKLIWWCCCMADRQVSAFMGRPVLIREDDYDTMLPEINQDEEAELWSPHGSDSTKNSFTPVPSRIMSCFCAASSLSVVIGDIITKIYPVKSGPFMPVAASQELEGTLARWYFDLPQNLRYDSNRALAAAPPHIIGLHVLYWFAMLLLHRGMLPKRQRSPELTPQASGVHVSDPAYMRSFETCQKAAVEISDIVNEYKERAGLTRSPPLLSSYVLSAGVMHIVTLTLRPMNGPASRGLQQCLTALKDMEVIWPSAKHSCELLRGVKLRFGDPSVEQGRPQETSGEVVMGGSDFTYGSVDEFNTHMMAQVLGLDIPDVGPSGAPYSDYSYPYMPEPNRAWHGWGPQPEAGSSHPHQADLSARPGPTVDPQAFQHPAASFTHPAYRNYPPI